MPRAASAGGQRSRGGRERDERTGTATAAAAAAAARAGDGELPPPFAIWCSCPRRALFAARPRRGCVQALPCLALVLFDLLDVSNVHARGWTEIHPRPNMHGACGRPEVEPVG
eukprot:236234-Chlamydomonas_euryale.AAC.2